MINDLNFKHLRNNLIEIKIIIDKIESELHSYLKKILYIRN